MLRCRGPRTKRTQLTSARATCLDPRRSALSRSLITLTRGLSLCWFFFWAVLFLRTRCSPLVRDLVVYCVRVSVRALAVSVRLHMVSYKATN